MENANMLYCPICATTAERFLPFGRQQRLDARCPNCGSLERHRFSWLYLTKETDLLDAMNARFLHFAPEACLRNHFRRIFLNNYVTADLLGGDVDINIDIESTGLPPSAFDIIYCSHVLEHVADDRKALFELRRILAPKGRLLILVPIKGLQTFEDHSIVSDDARLKAYGQENHVRQYGSDVANKITNTGFCVRVVQPHNFLLPEQISRMCISPPNRTLFDCTKNE